MNNFSFELRIAWREVKPSLRRFIFMIAAIALGVGSLTGIKGFSEALDRAMLRSAKDLVAADLSVRMSSAPNDQEESVLHSLVQRGALMTRVTETLSMTSAGIDEQPLLSNIKSVDPSFYPFYGQLKLDPSADLRRVLTDDAALVSRDLLVRTGAALGDNLQVGQAHLRIAALIDQEPDRLASGVDLGPRIIISRGALQRSGLIQFGSRATESFLFKLPSKGLTLEEARVLLRSGLRRAVRVSDYRDPNPSVSRGLERMTNFMSLIGLLALLVGGLGVATTIHTYLQQKLDTIAIMKCLGGRSVRIIRIYLVQGLALGLLGCLLGVALGYGVQILFPPFLKGLLDLPTKLEPAPGAVLQGLVIGIVTTLLFLLPPLLAIRNVRPARVFLREMPETRYSALARIRSDFLSFAAALLLFVGVGLLASWLAESLRRGFAFMAGLTGSILVLMLTAKLLLAGLKRLPRPSSLALRHGLRNLNRPGSHVAAVLVALGLGVAFILTVYFIQTSLLSQILKGAPRDFPNVFLMGITEREKEPLWNFLKVQPGMHDAGQPIPAVPARLQSVDGKSAGEMELDPPDRRYFQTEFVLTWTAALPPEMRLVEGRWWNPPYQALQISVGQHAARELKIHVGSTLEFLCSGRILRGIVANIRDVEFSRPGTSNQFIFSPGSLDDFPASYYGGLRIAPEQIFALQKSLFSHFPTVTSVDVGQVLTRVQDLLDRIANVIRFIALFAILSGIIMLASSVVATRYQRIREAVLLKTLGATRSQISRIQASEFLIIGLAAGVIGGVLASVAAYFLLGKLLDTEFEFRWMPLVAGAFATAAVAVVTGWLAGRSILNHKPLEVLREN